MILFTSKKDKSRTGKVVTDYGEMVFPVFMPDATYGTVSNLSFSDLNNTGTKAIVTNTLHLDRNYDSTKIRNFGSFHKLTNWDKPILTDSGGFQVFSLINRTKNIYNKITEAGCSFQDPRTGDYKFLSPETSQQIQHNIGSDIRVVLDEPVLENASLSSIKSSVERTTKWAIRSKKEFLKLNNLTETDFANNAIKRPLLTAVIQGSSNFEQRKKSLDALVEIGFDIYGFGGVPLKRERTWDLTYKGGFFKELLHFLAENLPQDKLRYALGVGTPDNISYAVSIGWDIFDTVLPTRNARHGLLYTSIGVGDKNYENYSVLHIKNSRYEYDNRPIDENCKCSTCQTVSRAFLRYLLKIEEGSGYRLATIHNLYFYNKFMEDLILKLKNNK